MNVIKHKMTNNWLIKILPIFTLLITTSVFAVDTDSDGIDDSVDNCINIPNIEQRDTDGDGYGNRCDGDLNGDCQVNTGDLNLYRNQYHTSSLNADLNGDGDIDYLDLPLFRDVFSMPGYQLSNIGNCVAPPP